MLLYVFSRDDCKGETDVNGLNTVSAICSFADEKTVKHRLMGR